MQAQLIKQKTPNTFQLTLRLREVLGPDVDLDKHSTQELRALAGQAFAGFSEADFQNIVDYLRHEDAEWQQRSIFSMGMMSIWLVVVVGMIGFAAFHYYTHPEAFAHYLEQQRAADRKK